jgi:hypothetical protein
MACATQRILTRHETTPAARAKVTSFADDIPGMEPMTAQEDDPALNAPHRLGADGIPGILDRDTLDHLLDVEFARARRYEHPFALFRVCITQPAPVRLVAGALRLHTRWSDSVGVLESGVLLVILRDTARGAAEAAVAKITTSLERELGSATLSALSFDFAAWRKGDDRERLISRLGAFRDGG